jgi:MOSC domain-containing protein YiiM
MKPLVTAVSSSSSHSFSKSKQSRIALIAGEGVEGDAHLGKTVQHLFVKRHNPDQPNLRQVHLIHSELHDELREAGFDVTAGQMGENVTTRGIDILSLPTGTRLRIGKSAVIEVTGLRNPCVQLDRFRPGLKLAVLDHDEHGELIHKSGVMSIVLTGGEVRPGDTIEVELPEEPHKRLKPV